MADAGLDRYFPALQHPRRGQAGAAAGAARARHAVGDGRQPRDASTGLPPPSPMPAIRCPCWSNATPAWAAAACSRRRGAGAGQADRRRARASLRRADDLSGRRPRRRGRSLAGRAPRRCWPRRASPARVISSGGTPDMWRAGEDTVVTEYRPGTYIYLDRYQVAKASARCDDCALTVLATVVSHPTADPRHPRRRQQGAVQRHAGARRFRRIARRCPARAVTGFSEEHGTVTLSGDAEAAHRRARARRARPLLRRHEPVRRGASDRRRQGAGNAAGGGARTDGVDLRRPARARRSAA